MNIFSEIAGRRDSSRLRLWAVILGWGLFAVALFAPGVEAVVASRDGASTRLVGWECAWLSLWMCVTDPRLLPVAVSVLAMVCTPFFAGRGLVEGSHVRFVAYWMIGAFLASASAWFLFERVYWGVYLWSASYVFVGVGFYGKRAR